MTCAHPEPVSELLICVDLEVQATDDYPGASAAAAYETQAITALGADTICHASWNI